MNHEPHFRHRTLAEIAEIASGVTKGRRLSGPAVSIPYLRVANVQAGHLRLDEIKEIETTAEELERYRLKKGDVLMTEGGDPDKLGRGALWEGAIDPCIHQNHVFRVRLDTKVVEPSYFVRFLATPPAITYFIRAAKQTTGIATINKTQLSALPVPLLPLQEQRRIADLLDKADAIRHKRKEAVALTEELLRSAFLDMFGDPVTNPNGWPLKPLEKLGRITTGNTPSRAVLDYFGNDIEWIKSDNINTPSHYLTRATEGLSAQGRAIGRTVPAGSTLMTCIAGSPDCIGNVALADREVAFNQQINAVTPHDGVDYRFLYVLLLVGKRLVKAASTNSMKGMVSKGKLEDVLVPSPPPRAQAKFGEAFDRVLRLSRRQEVAQLESQMLFDTTVQRAFSGELTS